MQNEFVENKIDLYEQIQLKGPELVISSGVNPNFPQGSKDFIQIIEITTKLAPLIVPLAVEIIRRLIPTKELIVKKITHPDGSVETIFNLKEY